MMVPPRSAVVLSCALAIVVSGCWPAPPAEPESTVIRNAALDLELEDSPQGFRVAINEGERLELLPVNGPEAGDGAPARAGRMWVEAGEPTDFGIDLVNIVNRQKEQFEALPGGEFFGSRKLVSPLGDAYYSRGRYDPEGERRVEEVRVFAVHPKANRLLTLFYRYPAAEDSGERVAEVLELLGLIRIESPESQAEP